MDQLEPGLPSNCKACAARRAAGGGWALDHEEGSRCRTDTRLPAAAPPSNKINDAIPALNLLSIRLRQKDLDKKSRACCTDWCTYITQESNVEETAHANDPTKLGLGLPSQILSSLSCPAERHVVFCFVFLLTPHTASGARGPILRRVWKV